MTITFRRCTCGDDVLEGMKLSKQAMEEEGLWNENTTFEEWAIYAGSHVLITEEIDDACS